MLYGGRYPKVTQVVFPNGAIDPWHALGVTTNLSSNALAIYIDGESLFQKYIYCSHEWFLVIP